MARKTAPKSQAPARPYVPMTPAELAGHWLDRDAALTATPWTDRDQSEAFAVYCLAESIARAMVSRGEHGFSWDRWGAAKHLTAGEGEGVPAMCTKAAGFPHPGAPFQLCIACVRAACTDQAGR